MTTEGYVTGLVSVEDGNPPASGSEYDPRRKVRVEIGFAYDVNGDAQPVLDRAAALANAKVQELLGRAAAAPLATAAQPAAEKPKAAARSKKADPAPPASSEPSAGTAGTGGSEPDPFEVAPESPEVAAQRAALAAEQVAEDDEFTVKPTAEVARSDEFDVTVAPPKEISDADLNAAVQKKNGEINNSQVIRELIGTFNPDPTRAFQLREIPAAQRQVFLDKLSALKKA